MSPSLSSLFSSPPPPSRSAVLLLSSLAFLVVGAYALVLSKLLPPPPASLPLLAAVRADTYYCLLLPLTVPVTLMLVATNWFSMQCFKNA